MHGMSVFETYAIWGVLGIAILGLLYAVFLRQQILKEDKGTQRMQEVWGSIKVGADVYLNRQLKTIIPFIGILVIALFFSVWIVNPTPEATEVFGNSARIVIAFGRALAFLMGAVFSLAVGQIGMRMAVEGNVRVAAAARTSFGEALRIAYRHAHLYRLR
jgi:K(+)-stimulated pyrophosphate-energized sodium pump